MIGIQESLLEVGQALMQFGSLLVTARLVRLHLKVYTLDTAKVVVGIHQVGIPF